LNSVIPLRKFKSIKSNKETRKKEEQKIEEVKSLED
jgi:hypothetical protein